MSLLLPMDNLEDTVRKSIVLTNLKIYLSVTQIEVLTRRDGFDVSLTQSPVPASRHHIKYGP
jgi:hypothetical protein